MKKLFLLLLLPFTVSAQTVTPSWKVFGAGSHTIQYSFPGQTGGAKSIIDSINLYFRFWLKTDTNSILQTIPNFYPKGDIRYLRKADSANYIPTWQFYHGNNTIGGTWEFGNAITAHGFITSPIGGNSLSIQGQDVNGTSSIHLNPASSQAVEINGLFKLNSNLKSLTLSTNLDNNYTQSFQNKDGVIALQGDTSSLIANILSRNNTWTGINQSTNGSGWNSTNGLSGASRRAIAMGYDIGGGTPSMDIYSGGNYSSIRYDRIIYSDGTNGLSIVAPASFTSGGNTITWPAATGTVALTSDLSNYVDLTTAQTVGGNKTLTGLTSFSQAPKVPGFTTGGIVFADLGGLLQVNPAITIDNASNHLRVSTAPSGSTDVVRLADLTSDSTYNAATYAKATDIATKPDTSVTNNLNLFNNAKKANYYEILKAKAAKIQNIYIKPYASSNLNIGLNFVDGKTVEYQMTKNADGIFVLNGVNVGNTSAASVPQVALNGASFNTSSTNSYTTHVGDRWTVSFTGNSISLNTFMDNRGGVWSFYLSPTASYPTGLYKSLSMYSSSTVSSITLPIFANLPENTYTVTATFIGDDPAHVPSGGAGTSRGWFKYSSSSPQTVASNTLTGVLDAVNRKIILPTGTIDDLAIEFRKLGTSDTLNWVLYHGVLNGTRNIKYRMYVNDKLVTAPDSITTLINGVDKIVFVQTYDAYYPTGSLKMWSGEIRHTFDPNGLNLMNDLTFATDSCQTGASYLAMISGHMGLVNKLTVGDTTYNLSTPGSGIVTTNIKTPSENIKYNGTWAGSNWQIAAHVNLASALDYPRNPYKYGKTFFTQRSSGIAKLYYNISGQDSLTYRTFKNGDHLINSTQIFISKIPAVTDTTRALAGTKVQQPLSGGTGYGAAPTASQVLVGQNSGIYVPRNIAGVVSVADTAGTTAFGSFSSATLATALTDETGSGGGFVRATLPTFITNIKTPAIIATGFTSGTAGTDSLLVKNATTNVVGKIAANSYIATSTGRIGTATLTAGTVAVSITGITTSSKAFCTRTVASGTTLTTGITAVCTAGTLTITADVAAGTINTADTSTYNYMVVN